MAAPCLHLILLFSVCFRETVTAFGVARTGVGHFLRHGDPRCCRGPSLVSMYATNDESEDWDMGNVEEGPRLDAWRSMLEASWNHDMGPIPSSPEEGAEAAAEAIADALRARKNVVMVDLRLPSYDMTEGATLYNPLEVYDFCSSLSDNLQKRELIRKSLVLVHSDKERATIDRARSQREEQGGVASEKKGNAEGNMEGGKVDEFRQRIMSSWESVSNEPPPVAETKVPEDEHSSHRLWSMIGTEELSPGPDMFDQVITAVDRNALLRTNEDALIIVAPHDAADTIAVRRIMARYGHTRTIILVNARMEPLPRELAPALLVYGIMPLVARSPGKDAGETAGLKAVVMKRFPADWAVYVDASGEGFVEAGGSQIREYGTDKSFPSPQWIAQRVQAHIEDLPKKQ